jgi:uncharacterized membrane protein
MLAMTLLASLRVSLHRIIDEPKTLIAKFATSSGWLVLLVMILPVTSGFIARGEYSAFPWTTFIKSYETTGNWLTAAGHALLVIVFEIWAFFGVSQYLLKEREKTDFEYHKWGHESDVLASAVDFFIQDIRRRRRRDYLIINVLIGLLLCSPGNLLYEVLTRMPSANECSIPGAC